MFWAMPCSMQGISSQPGIKPVPPAMKVQNLNHWIARKVSMSAFSASGKEGRFYQTMSKASFPVLLGLKCSSHENISALKLPKVIV